MNYVHEFTYLVLIVRVSRISMVKFHIPLGTSHELHCS